MRMSAVRLRPGAPVGSKSKTWKYHQEQDESLFGVSRRQLKRWENDGILARNSLRSVVSLYIKHSDPFCPM